jgi:beta-galactosidase
MAKAWEFRKKNKSTPQNRYRLMWMDVKYEPGTVKVVAFDDNGKAVAEQEVHTAGKPYQIVLDADRKTITANGEDISFVLSVVDKNEFLPYSDKPIKISGYRAGT